jgi:hypothetical protein
VTPEDTTAVAGIPIPSTSPIFLTVVGLHVLVGLVCVVAGAIAMLSPKCRGRHPTFGTIYYWGLVAVHQASITAAKLIPIAGQEVASAEEALRLTQQDLRTGTGLTIDVLQAENAAEKARLRRATAMVRYNQAQINLLAALGLIDQTNMEDKPTAVPVLGVQAEPSESIPK